MGQRLSYLHLSGLTSTGAASFSVKTNPLIRYGIEQSHPDMTLHSSGHTVVAWENSTSGGVFYSIIDTASGNNIVAGRRLANITGGDPTDTRAPKVVSVGSYVLIFCVAGFNLYYAAIDMASPEIGAGALTIVTTELPTDGLTKNYDASIIGGTCVVVYGTASGSIKLRTLDGLINTLRATITATPSGCIGVFAHPTTGQAVIAWGDSTAGAETTYYAVCGGSNFSTVVKSPTSVDSGSCVGITGTYFADGSIAFFYTQAPSNPTLVSRYVIRTRVLAANGTWTVAACDFRRSVGLAGKAFTIGNQAYVPAVFDSLFQPTVFLLDQSGMPVAKALTDVAAGQPGGPANITLVRSLPEPNATSTSATYAWMEKVTVASSGIKSVSFTYGAKATGAVLADALHFGRGILWMYDGVSMVEHGFHLFPEVPAVPNPGGAFIYQYATTFAWTDSKGNIHRSAPSVPVTQAQASAIDATANAVHVTLPTLALTRKPSITPGDVAGAPVEIEVWRTINGGTTFFRCHATNQTPPFNDPTVDTVSFVDGMSDAQIQANPMLYTTGGVLENYPVNPPLYIVQIRNRLWVIDETNPLVGWYSKEVAPGSPVEFCGPGSGTLTFNFESKGPGVAMASLDDKVILMRENSMAQIEGTGPSATGNGDDFNEVPLPTDVGCVDPGSVMVGGGGVTFKSNKGFYLLDRGLNTSYIGADIESFNDYPVTSATVLPKTNWAIFTLGNGGGSLIYDYLYQQWSTLPSVVGALDACVYKGRFAFVDASGVVYTETPAAFAANGGFMGLMAETSWVKVGAMAGLQRVYKLLVLGQWKSSHSLKVDVYVDYDDSAPVQSDTFDCPTTRSPYILRIDARSQQCTSMKIRLTEIQNGTAGEGLTLSSISLLVGMKPGLRRVETANTKG